MEIETECTQAEVIAQVKSLAEASYSRLLLQQEESNTWLCHRHDSIKYSFRVTFCPAYVVLYGDISSQMLFCRAKNGQESLEWLLSTAGDAADLFEGAQIKQMAFFIKDALAVCAEIEDRSFHLEEPDESLRWKNLAEKFKHNMAQGEDPREAWLYASHAIFHEAKDKIGIGYGSDMLWQQQALLTFVRLYQQRQNEIPISRL